MWKIKFDKNKVKSKGQNVRPKKKVRSVNTPKKSSQLNQMRTTNTITQSLGSLSLASRPNSGSIKPYVKCRADPFNSNGQYGIPDGTNANFIIVDSYSVNNIACTQFQTSFTIQTLPCLPAMAMVGAAPSTTLVIDGTVVTAPALTSPNSAITNAWRPICIPQPYSNSPYAPGAAIEDPYNSSVARMVAVGYRITYTGPVLSCAGSITVTENKVGFTEIGQTTSGTGVASTAPYSIVTSDRTNTLAGVFNQPAGTTVLAIDITTNPNAMTASSVTFRPEEGILVLPKHSTIDFKNQIVRDNPACVVANPSTNSNTLANMLQYVGPIGSPTYHGTVIWYDNDWTSVQIVFNGINQDATFRVESVLCMEYGLQVSSPFLPLSHKFSSNDRPQIVTATEMMKRVPVAMPMAPRRR